MTSTANIEQLARLLAEEERVSEKIRETQAALAGIKKKISEALVDRYVSITQEKKSLPEDLMREEQSYERLLQALVDMRNEIANQIRPVEEQIVQTAVDQIRKTFEEEKNKLEDCLSGIDQKILDCRLHIEEYQRIRSHLDALNERLTHFGRETLLMPEPLSSSDLGDLVRGRIDQLRSHGKI